MLINEESLVPGFNARLVYIMDENEETANEECDIKSICRDQVEGSPQLCCSASRWSWLPRK